MLDQADSAQTEEFDQVVPEHLQDLLMLIVDSSDLAPLTDQHALEMIGTGGHRYTRLYDDLDQLYSLGLIEVSSVCSDAHSSCITKFWISAAGLECVDRLYDRILPDIDEAILEVRNVLGVN